MTATLLAAVEWADVDEAVARLEADARLYAEVAFCAEKGVAPSLFNGRPWAPGDPLWVDDDQALVLAYRMLESTRCAGCGTTKRERAEFAFVAQARHCSACERIAEEQQNIDAARESAPTRFAAVRAVVTRAEWASGEQVQWEKPVEVDD